MASYHRLGTAAGLAFRQPIASQPRQRRPHGRRRVNLDPISLVEIDPAHERRAPRGFLVALPMALLLWTGILAAGHALF